ncbi:Third part of one of two inversely orientated ORFs in ISC1043 [Saccharolobus solfataricus P2]|uniref:Third part of one of two inversely orientated ORFs in ISC1043 n=2 Tax=Saccharolobus solfataricus TaxID=2287 RepID=Q97Y60_SACS2|nr:Third part of one of two inversely orientated ORFs in ISC1043 [Saccharolobus solfataricus P2]SAI85183.1 ORF in transposon ISC1043 [Saccharolobus solfataricus]
MKKEYTKFSLPLSLPWISLFHSCNAWSLLGNSPSMVASILRSSTVFESRL